MDGLKQLLKDLTDSWGVPWAVIGMKRQNRDAGGQLLKGQQGIPVEFLGNGGGGEGSLRRREIPEKVLWTGRSGPDQTAISCLGTQ